MLQIGKQMLVKDGLLDEEVAANAELRQNRFMDKIEKVENDVDDMMTRLARLVAEQKSSMQKMREVVKLRKDFLLSQGITF